MNPLTYVCHFCYAFFGIFVVTYLFWTCYLAYTSLKASKDLNTLPRVAFILALPLIAAAYVLDVFYNIFIASFIFLELPRTLTLTARCSSHLSDTGWRGNLARWLCKNLLDPFQTGGHCHGAARD